MTQRLRFCHVVKGPCCSVASLDVTGQKLTSKTGTSGQTIADTRSVELRLGSPGNALEMAVHFRLD